MQNNVLFSLTVLVEDSKLVLDTVTPKNLPYDRNMLEAIMLQFNLNIKTADNIAQIIANAAEDIAKEVV